MKRLELRLEARAEFLEAVRQYEAQRAGLGARFKAEVDRTLARIAAEIVVLAILHSRRNPEIWKRRR